MPVMIVDGIQYSARMVVKQYENKGHVLDELSLYNMAMHKEKAPSHTNLSASERGGAQYEGAVSGYKVKDLIHNTQAGDRKLLGLDENSRTRFSLPDDVKLTKRERELRDGLVEKVSRAIGSENVITDVEAGERVLDMLNGRARLSKGQKRALETAVPGEVSPFKATVVSNADVAKVLENLDKLAKDFENLSNQPKYFIGNVAQAIGARKYGSNSQYATFETKNGQIVTTRLTNHNAHTSGFYYDGKDNDAKAFRDGKASVVIRTDFGDFLYDAKRLSQVADFMAKHGIDQFQFSGDIGKILVENKSAIGLVMPKFFGGDDIKDVEAFGYDIRTDKRGERFSLPNDGRLADKEVANVIVESADKNLPTNRKEALEALSKMTPPFINKDQQKEIKVSKNAIRHAATQDHNRDDVLCMGVIDRIIADAVKIGGVPVKADEKGHTHAVEVYYCPVNIDRRQYSARLVVKQYENRGKVLEDFCLFDLHSKQEKTEASSAVRDKIVLTPASASVKSAYKVKDLIYNSKAEDRKLLGLDENSRTRFSLPERKDKKPVFYSNAERAVEGIRQEKAKAEQWLAMIQKQGGLKAAEDKWIGLSDRLKELNGKSLTKQEVLDYIRENDVQVEEVAYINPENNTEFISLKKEYDHWLRNGGYDYAWEQLRERFGDDAEIAFTDYGGELEISNEDAADVLIGGGKAINDTRLGYTTQGLNNKREIALTVPTIEPYNESDTIHFGDAGEGKLTEKERELRERVVDVVRNAIGAENVITDVETSQRVLDLVNGVVALSRGKKRALETASVSQEEEHPADISSADGAKILQEVRNLAKKSENLDSRCLTMKGEQRKRRMLLLCMRTYLTGVCARLLERKVMMLSLTRLAGVCATR